MKEYDRLEPRDISEDLKKSLDKELQKVLEKKLKDVDVKEKDALRVAAR